MEFVIELERNAQCPQNKEQKEWQQQESRRVKSDSKCSWRSENRRESALGETQGRSRHWV